MSWPGPGVYRPDQVRQRHKEDIAAERAIDEHVPATEHRGDPMTDRQPPAWCYDPILRGFVMGNALAAPILVLVWAATR